MAAAMVTVAWVDVFLKFGGGVMAAAAVANTLHLSYVVCRLERA